MMDNGFTIYAVSILAASTCSLTFKLDNFAWLDETAVRDSAHVERMKRCLASWSASIGETERASFSFQGQVFLQDELQPVSGTVCLEKGQFAIKCANQAITERSFEAVKSRKSLLFTKLNPTAGHVVVKAPPPSMADWTADNSHLFSILDFPASRGAGIPRNHRDPREIVRSASAVGIEERGDELALAVTGKVAQFEYVFNSKTCMLIRVDYLSSERSGAKRVLRSYGYGWSDGSRLVSVKRREVLSPGGELQTLEDFTLSDWKVGDAADIPPDSFFEHRLASRVSLIEDQSDGVHAVLKRYVGGELRPLSKGDFKIPERKEYERRLEVVMGQKQLAESLARKGDASKAIAPPPAFEVNDHRGRGSFPWGWIAVALAIVSAGGVVAIRNHQCA